MIVTTSAFEFPFQARPAMTLRVISHLLSEETKETGMTQTRRTVASRWAVCWRTQPNMAGDCKGHISEGIMDALGNDPVTVELWVGLLGQIPRKLLKDIISA
jgi:hypothetical protein